MMKNLTSNQEELMREFYSNAPVKVTFNKKSRKKLWEFAKKRDEDIDLPAIAKECPSLAYVIKRSYDSGDNIQPAIFSECVYTKALADVFDLNVYVNCLENKNFLTGEEKKLLNKHNLFPKYCYTNNDRSRLLVQAGGCKGIDCALISIKDLSIHTIELKEPGAKTSEPDLPKYNEDGNMLVTEEFLNNYPQFTQMLEEQKCLNFFDKMGSNENNFTAESIDLAVSNNYTKKYAEVICTEDKKGNLVMMPANDVSRWADIQGEIRPAGKNHYKAWTPKALEKFIIDKGGVIDNNMVTIEKSRLDLRKERGGNGKVSGYKINSLFFVYTKYCSETDNNLYFDFDKIEQLNPTIAGKMFFKKLLYADVKKFYFEEN